MTKPTRSLAEQRAEFARRPFIATPLAGTIVWLIIGISSFFLSPTAMVWTLFIGTGSIIYLALFISKFTGEDFLDKTKPKNAFDTLFLMTVGEALLVYSIAIPFFLIDYTSLPLTVGILSGIMWVPFSWIINHWVGVFHAVTRTASVLILWYTFPNDRFTTIPFAIVIIYLATMIILKSRKIQPVS